MSLPTRVDLTLARRLDDANVPRTQIARRFGVSSARISQLLGTKGRAEPRPRPTKACPDCGAKIDPESARCQPCHHKARKAERAAMATLAAALVPVPPAPADDAFIRVPVPFDGRICSVAEIGGPRPLDDSGARGADLTWACRTEAEAATMRAVFAGRLGDVPSRRAFAPMPWMVDA